jgi:LPS sulfotransferase NodH
MYDLDPSAADIDWSYLPGARVPFDLSALLCRSRGQIRAGDAPGRVTSSVALRLVLHGLVQAGWLIDEILRLSWRDAQFQGPLFIVGHQRSGTTLLHRLLSANSDTCTLLLHEMLLPAVSLQRVLEGIAWVDKQGGRPLGKRFKRYQDRLFGPLDQWHKIRFDDTEEDEFALWTIFASGMCLNESPYSAAMPEMETLRRFEEWLPQRRAETLGWYRACLLKKVYRMPGRSQEAPWVIAKNPAFTAKVTYLRRVFPTAKFVYLWRNPLQAIPSRLSLIRAIWRHRFAGFQEMSPAQVQAIYADSVKTYLAAERDLSSLPDDLCLTILYSRLVENPCAVACAVASHFGLPQPAAVAARVVHPQRQHELPRHRYSLDEFGLDETTVRRDLAPVMERAHIVL